MCEECVRTTQPAVDGGTRCKGMLVTSKSPQGPLLYGPREMNSASSLNEADSSPYPPERNAATLVSQFQP